MKFSKYVVLLSLFFMGSVLHFVPSGDQIVTYAKDVTFAVGMGALLLLLVELASGGKLLAILQEMVRPTLIEHESGNKAQQEFRKAFEEAKSIDYFGLTFSFPRMNFSMEDFEKKLKQGVCFRILVSAEDSPFLADRARHSQVEEIVMKADIRETIGRFQELHSQLIGNKEITGRLYLRTHKELPYRGYSRFDNRTFVTPYLTDNSAATGPLLEITKANSFLSIGYNKQFEAFWNTADSIVNIHQFQLKETDNKANPADAETARG